MSKLIVTIAAGVPAERIPKIQGYLDKISREEPDFNGVIFSIARGEYTEIDGSEKFDLSLVGVFREVQRIAAGEDEE